MQSPVQSFPRRWLRHERRPEAALVPLGHSPLFGMHGLA